MKERVPTGIEGFDSLIEGGIPRGSLVVVAGRPGSGKTIFAAQYLWFGLEHDEAGLYVSFAEDRDAFLRNMKRFGMDFEKYEQMGKFVFLDFVTVKAEGVGEILTDILERVDSSKAKRLVIDSLTALTQGLTEKMEVRGITHTVLGRMTLGRVGLTTLLIVESSGSDVSGPEEYVADGVIILEHMMKEKAEERTLQISKMRGTPVPRMTFEFLIDENYGGLSVIALPTRAATDVAPTEKLTTGVEGLDKVLDGGVFRRSIALVEGPEGVGKTTLCLQFLFSNARKGEKALFATFEEPIGQIKRMLKTYWADYEKVGDSFGIDAYVPEAFTPLHYYKLLRDMVEKHRPTVLGIDSLTAVMHTMPRGEFRSFMRYLQLLCKEKGLTVFLTSSTGKRWAELRSGASTFVDDIVLMRYRELDGKMVREIMVAKSRGTAEDRIMRFDVTGEGIVVH
jgi:circadian clock protein KaiC